MAKGNQKIEWEGRKTNGGRKREIWIEKERRRGAERDGGIEIKKDRRTVILIVWAWTSEFVFQIHVIIYLDLPDPMRKYSFCTYQQQLKLKGDSPAFLSSC